jgi:RNA ligase
MLEILEKYHQDGLLHKQTHPIFDLTIWNYTPKVQYDKLWDDITLQCRGLVTNSKGEIVARPFKKFFNYEEHKPEDIPNEDYVAYEKMDGSLGILFYYENEWILATRGSFTSPQAFKGKEILDRHDISAWRKDNTYLFEIIYPGNRIVVDYGDEEKLVVLGAIHTETGEEIPDSSLFWTQDSGFEVVTTYKTWGEGYDLLKEEIQKDREGYVLRFKNGFRMKIKGDEYVRLHRILTNISNRDIWEYLKNNKSFDELLEKVPDEFNDWVKETIRDLQNQFDNIKLSVEDEFKELINKKEFAEKIKDNPNRSFLFKRLDSYSSQLNEMIWHSIYPSYSKPFKNEKDTK